METKTENKDFPMLEEYRQFISEKSDFNVHTGKTCYVSQKNHARISQITSLLKEQKISISIYIDMVLEEHFKKYGSSVDYFMIEKFKEQLEKGRKD